MERVSVRVGRVYDEPSHDDGTRVLVDRLWPRGLTKDKAHLDEWCKEIAPSTELRRWYGHDPDLYPEFRRRYRRELREPERSEILKRLKHLAASHPVTLLTASKQVTISEATVIAELMA
ncbi:MAG TPA: DUF488 family protein [Micromonosporaceae bacterium]|jgi:uncharacterized protein YeaO (DUF488 family)